MDIGSIFLILALFIPVILFILRPIFERSLLPVAQPGQDISTLMAERDHIIAIIKELDDDYNLGKIPVEEYPSQRQALLQNGADILRKIDIHQSIDTNLPMEDRLEAVILAHRQNLEANLIPKKNGNAVPPVPDDELEQKIASRRRTMQGRSVGFCPKCGRPVQDLDRYCPHCGATLFMVDIPNSESHHA
ncbi:MAG TPA: zinc-ribbon domain-containing protein [Anaerolineales bacterium]|nr:zinc-ribbon domain-containing protein [Anaerolineales bacterium]